VYLSKTPDAILRERLKQSIDPDIKQRRHYESELNQFIAFQRKQDFKVATLQVIWASIRSFFELNYTPLVMRKGDYPTGDSEGVKRATDDAIRKALSRKNKLCFQSKPLILFAKDTGLRISDIVALKCGNIPEKIEKGICPIQINLISQKTNLLTKTFIGKEAIDALREYFRKREQGSKWNKEIIPERITPSSPLFRKWISGNIQHMHRISATHIISDAFNEVGEYRMSAHSLRKRLQTQLEKGGMPTNWIDQVLGHKLINSRDAYSLPTDEELRDSYVKAYPLVAVNMEAKAPKAENSVLQISEITPDMTKALLILSKFAQSLNS
jgi:integrase